MVGRRRRYCMLAEVMRLVLHDYRIYRINKMNPVNPANPDILSKTEP